MSSARGEEAALSPCFLGRRALLAAPAILGAAAGAGVNPAVAWAAEGATFLVPGPEDGSAARWALRIGESLARGVPRGTRPAVSVLGGPDGVTAANRFATLEAVDGRTLLVLSGATAQARLTGGSRARYEPAAWIPLAASWHGAVLAGRGSLPAPDAAPTRIAVPAPDAPETAALAALDALGIPCRPVPGRPEAAFATGEADAILVTGPDPVAAAASIGAVPWHVIPPLAAAAEPAPFGGATPGHHAARAAVAALQLRHLLVLPALTPADSVAAWRRAAARWAEDGRADPSDGRPLVGAEAAAALALLAPPPDAVLAYRGWLEARLGWRPA